MPRKLALCLGAALTAALSAAACAETPSASAGTATRTATSKTHTAHGKAAPGTPVGSPAKRGALLPRVTVHKSPTCGCCARWVEHVRGAGFQVEVRDTDQLEAIKQRVGVPYAKGSCHTAEVGGYFVEGHVPVADIQRLLREKPRARGLTVPGMPLGSPGMEMPDGRTQPYVVELVKPDGTTAEYARH